MDSIPDGTESCTGTLSEANVPFDKQMEVNEAKRTLESTFAALVKISDIQDPELLYFVDCGDHNPVTLTRKDKFGIYNSVTDQLFEQMRLLENTGVY